MKQLLEAGVHFGHQTRRWNPKMRQYIFTARNNIHIIDLQQTVGLLDQAFDYVRDLGENGRTILFVGTKKQAQEAVQDAAARCGMYYVNQRWLGGMLTNFQTMQQRLRYLSTLEAQRDGGELAALPKHEQQGIDKEIAKLNRMLGGVKGMRRLPDAIFIVDTHKERLAVMEALRLQVPIVALVDTNSDPDEVDYPIPANDDAIRAVRLICDRVADAVIEGRNMRIAALADTEGATDEDLESLPTSFAPDESELQFAPPALPPTTEAGEPVAAPEIMAPSIEDTLAPGAVAGLEKGSAPFA
jgi:small subunit ribosomal protein S2